MTHSRVLYSSNSAGLLSTSDPIIGRQDVVDPPYKIVYHIAEKFGGGKVWSIQMCV